ncbi:MAG: helix-turn-helix transcriptional regulator [Janthinobacterium lividum]
MTNDAASRGLANRIKQVRMERDLTQVMLADMVGVSRKTINTVENGIFIPSVLLSLLIARALRVTIDELFYIIP